MTDEEIRNEVERLFGVPKHIVFKNNGYIPIRDHLGQIAHSEAFLYTGRFEGYKMALQSKDQKNK